MCNRPWTDIQPATVPGRALKKYSKAFLNMPVSGNYGRTSPSEKEDRIACATTFSNHLTKAAKGEAKVNGMDTVFPHEIVHQIRRGVDRLEYDVLQAQWRAIVNSVRETGALNRTLAMCDFSGSMEGTPMDVSMALGMLISEVNDGVFANHILTFDSTPTLHRFREEGIVNRVIEVRGLAQGLSTNFQAAYNLVLKHLVENAVPVGMEPKDIIVLTDMGWDAATGMMPGAVAVKTKEKETHIAIARRAFKLQGELLFGEGNGWQPPRIVIWNLNGNSEDYHVTKNEEGVIQVAGWSPSLLKVLTTKGADALTPDAMLRTILSAPRYDAVRNCVRPLFN